MAGAASLIGKVSEILGKVTTASHEIPRGADVSFRIGVPEQWLAEGRTIEIELPRNLTCAKCSGGGCGVCGNAGAITLRSRTDLPELVQVVLPLASLINAAIGSSGGTAGAEGLSRSGKHATPRPIVIRVPECGGLPDSEKGEIMRGLLLLTVDIAAEASSNVRILDEDSIDSSKMLRAVVRTSGKTPAGPDFKTVVLPRRSRAPKTGPDDTQAPASHVAPAGSSAPPKESPATTDRQRDTAAADLPSLVVRPSMDSKGSIEATTPARGGGHSAVWIYLAITLIAVVAAILGWMLY